MRSGHGCRRGGRVGLGWDREWAAECGARRQSPDGIAGRGPVCGVQERLLIVGDAMFDLSHAEPWDARPDWDALRARRAQIVAAAHIARRSIAGLSERSLLKQAGPAVEAAVAAFQQAWQQVASADSPSTIRNLQSAICNLCGLGPGLTPAGDDWLAGWLLAQHLVARPARSRRPVRSRHRSSPPIAPRPSRVPSWRAQPRGRPIRIGTCCSHALAEDPMTNLPIYQSTDAILSHGATSGAAMLAGFFAGIEMPARCLLIS